MVKIIEDENCHFFPNMKCKWPLDENAMKANLDSGNSDDVHSIRPFEHTGTCTNCLLSMILKSLMKE